MCGICGIVGSYESQAIEAMITAMHHRGPDDSGIFMEDGVALGMARLAIIDVSLAAHQPMSNPEKTVWIVYNGEVYNFRSERGLLESKGYTFSSSSDTEVVLRMYEHYGDDFLLRLRGMFALAIYDKRRGPGQERILLARDQLGIKPLLYARTGSNLLFASELKALLASGLVERWIEPLALQQLLAFGSVSQPHTMLQGVKMLLPGHRMIIEGGQERIERYWSLETDRYLELRRQSYEEQVEEVGRVLQETARMQLVSDVPLGAFLSGGVDSSVLVAMMAREVGHHVKTFSVGFEAEGEHLDESEDARRTADYLGTDHTHVLVTGLDVRNRIQHIAASLDQPSVDGVNSYFVSLAARQAVTVAISGTGGDEIYAGYPWFISMDLHQSRLRKLNWTKRSLFQLLEQHPEAQMFLPQTYRKRLEKNEFAKGFLAKYSTLYQIFGASASFNMLSPEMKGFSLQGAWDRQQLSAIDELAGGSAIERVSGLCLRGYTNNQLLRDIDAVSMAHSLEVRVPYLDPVVVDMALSLPDSAKLGMVAGLSDPTRRTYRETGTKRILIDVGKALLPKDFDLQPKRGFAMPFDKWLQGSLRDILMDTLSEQSLKTRKLFDVRQGKRIREQFLDGNLSWAQPWLLMICELWCREVLD